MQTPTNLAATEGALSVLYDLRSHQMRQVALLSLLGVAQVIAEHDPNGDIGYLMCEATDQDDSGALRALEFRSTEDHELGDEDDLLDDDTLHTLLDNLEDANASVWQPFAYNETNPRPRRDVGRPKLDLARIRSKVPTLLSTGGAT